MQVSYEVYTLSGGRWLFDSRYDNEAKDLAIDEARQLAKRTRVEATKVIQEDYYEGTHFVREWTVYSTRPNRLKGRALNRFNLARAANTDSRVGRRAKSAANASTAGISTDHASAHRLRQRTILRRMQLRQLAALLGKLIVIIVASFGFATLTTLFYARAWIA
ncbi:MAG: hypothetical protein O3A21_04220 [Proteobacteria bacterium]|nr:hypothetical protein [Pseudomonadota bacterium]